MIKTEKDKAQHHELVQLLKDARNICGASASYLFRYLKYIDNTQHQHLLISLNLNLHLLEHRVAKQLLDLDINVLRSPYDHNAFRNMRCVEVNLVEELKLFLLERKMIELAVTDCHNKN